ncbi:hypothetical protein HII31_10912 [Pseudocercospora fuligena]|uniref:Uncharacterized protein n=1 Tax=Pseudocercospora fuligena TaxID=685502 RepID=A0A8H6RD07_9PEZI|nr:hypothetical protein HII31_10912 [Pseudocercospora fuligena]
MCPNLRSSFMCFEHVKFGRKLPSLSQALKKDCSSAVPVIKNQDWKKSQWHGWADRVNPNTSIEYKSPLEPAGDKKARGQNAKKKPHVYSNHWDQDPRDPDYVEDGEDSENDERDEKEEDVKEAARRDASDSEYEEPPKEKVGRKKSAAKKRTTKSGGRRA